MKRLLSYVSLALYYLSSTFIHASTENENEEEKGLKKAKSYNKVKKLKSRYKVKQSKSYDKSEMGRVINNVADYAEEEDIRVEELTDNVNMLNSYLHMMSQDFLAGKQTDNKRFEQIEEAQKVLQEHESSHELEDLRSSLASCKDGVEKGNTRFWLATAIQAGFVCAWGGFRHLKGKQKEASQKDPQKASEKKKKA